MLPSGFRRDEAGASMVEFAIVAPLLFMLIFAIIDFGRGIYLANNLVAAVREGARFAASQPDPTLQAVKDSAGALVKSYLTTAHLRNVGGMATPPTPTVSTSGASPGGTLQVTVTLAGYIFSPITPLVPMTRFFGAGMGNITMPSTSATFRSEGAWGP